MEVYRQLSLFDVKTTGYPLAVNLFDGEEFPTMPLKSWMERLVQEGEYLVMVGKYPCVLRKTDLKREQVRVGHEFYHYYVGGAVYAGIFVGIGDEDTDDEGKGDGCFE